MAVHEHGTPVSVFSVGEDGYCRHCRPDAAPPKGDVEEALARSKGEGKWAPSVEPLPCPFCGGEPYIHEPQYVGADYQIGCEGDVDSDSCPSGPFVDGETFEKAVELWNHRAAHTKGEGWFVNQEWRDGLLLDLLRDWELSAETVACVRNYLDAHLGTEGEPARSPVAWLCFKKGTHDGPLHILTPDEFSEFGEPVGALPLGVITHPGAGT